MTPETHSLAMTGVRRWSASDSYVLLLATAMTAAAMVLVGLFDFTLVNPDTVQLISAARHLIAGEGLSTSIVYYDSQHDFGVMPAPLTVWPPGYVWMLAGAAALRLPVEHTAFAISLISHLFIAVLVYSGLRRLAVSALIATVAALVWLAHPAAWSIVLAAYTEPFFIAVTLASCFSIVRATQSTSGAKRWLLAAGAFAAMAILVRYSGILWPLAVGFWFLISAIRMRTWRSITDAIAFGSLPALTTMGLFWRNHSLTGRLSGGQFEYGGAATLSEALHRMYWEAGSLLGSLVTAEPLILAAAVSVATAAVLMTIRQMRHDEPRSALLGLSLMYIATLAAFLLTNAMLSSASFLDYRYWLPGLPFLLFALSVATDESLLKMRRPSAKTLAPWYATWPLTIAIAAGAFAVSAASELAIRWPIAPVHPATAVIEQALNERLPDGRTLRDFLTTPADLDRPILAHHEHRFALLTRRAVVGLADARFTQRVWTSDKVAALVRDRGISQVVFFPTMYDPALPINANTPFFDDLRNGPLPQWLRPRYTSEIVVVYDVVANEP